MRKNLYNFSPTKTAGSRLLGWMTGLCLLSATVGQAQVTSTVTIGSGTGTISYLPINGYYGYTYSQQIYMASEVSSANVNGYISKIRFYVTNANQSGMANAKDWVVYLANTTKSSFSGGTDWVPVAQLTSVFTGSVTYPATAGWVEVALPTPFLYLAGKNLVVAVDENTPSYTASTLYWQSTTGTGNRSLYYYNDPNDVNPASPPSGTTSSSFANAQMDFTTLPPCTNAPTPGATLAGTTTMCAGATTSFSVQNNTDFMTYAGITYQWQVDNGSGAGFTNINGATDLVYTPASMNVSAVYQAVVACGTNSTAATPVIVQVNPLPTLIVAPSSNAACNSGSVNLSVTGASTFTWSPATFLSGTSGANVVSTPTAYIAYSVMGTDANGCINDTTVSVTTIQKLPVSLAMPTNVCSAGTTYSLDIASDVPVGNPGSWEFQWFDGTGAVAQAWSGFSTFNTSNIADGIYTYKMAIRNTACPNETTDTVAIQVTVGFGADIDTSNVNCNRPYGTFFLNNVFGQRVTNQWANYDFSSSTLSATTASLSANAVISGGRCNVTPSATSNRGAFSIFNPMSINAQDLDVNFLLTMDQPINNYGTGGADGLSWSYGNDVAYSTTASIEDGLGTKLRIAFDAADNSGTNGNVKGIYLAYGWPNTTAFGPASTPYVLAYSSNVNWKLQTDVPVTIHVSKDGQLTLTVGGTVIFNKIQLPAAYVAANKSTWFHTFSAATGGDALRQAIDNLQINYSDPIDIGVAPGYSGTAPSNWQTNTIVDSLNVGFYDLWLANPGDHNCNRFLGTYEIKNINPVVDLGNDTNLCPGNSIVLNAGGPFVSYTWANGAAITQTVVASNPGYYMVNVVDTAGCPGSGIIHVGQLAEPSASGIFSSPSGGNAYFLSVLNPQDVTTFDWSFGDGTSENNDPSTLSHTYPSNGVYTVTVTLHNANGCGTTTVTGVVNITVGIEEAATANGIKMYPNPASNVVTLSTDNGDNINGVSVLDVTGKLVYSTTAPASSINIDVANFGNGVYTLQIVSAKGTSYRRLTIAINPKHGNPKDSMQ